MKKDYNFGYTKVNSKQKTKLVQNVFSSVAPSYDIMNDLMSLGMHRLWKKRFVETVNLKENEIILDVGSGSGDIASEILKKNLSTSLYLLDLNEEMLLEGRKIGGDKVKKIVQYGRSTFYCPKLQNNK